MTSKFKFYLDGIVRPFDEEVEFLFDPGSERPVSTKHKEVEVVHFTDGRVGIEGERNLVLKVEGDVLMYEDREQVGAAEVDDRPEVDCFHHDESFIRFSLPKKGREATATYFRNGVGIGCPRVLTGTVSNLKVVGALYDRFWWLLSLNDSGGVVSEVISGKTVFAEALSELSSLIKAGSRNSGSVDKPVLELSPWALNYENCRLEDKGQKLVLRRSGGSSDEIHKSILIGAGSLVCSLRVISLHPSKTIKIDHLQPTQASFLHHGKTYTIERPEVGSLHQTEAGFYIKVKDLCFGISTD